MIVLLDNGHGALINGEYQTAGKRSPVWNDGTQLFEGEFNRSIINGIIEELTRLNIPYVNICPEYRDVTLETRVRRANKYPRNSFFLSVHSNAGGGHGFEVFSYPGTSLADDIATEFGHAFQHEFPSKRLRADYSDGDLDKEAKFYVLKKTVMPAVLTENFFMDDEEECKTILMTREGRQRIVRFHVEAILKVKQLLY